MRASGTLVHHSGKQLAAPLIEALGSHNAPSPTKDNGEVHQTAFRIGTELPQKALKTSARRPAANIKKALEIKEQ